MNNIEVKDVDLLIEQAERVAQLNQNILNNVEQLQSLTNKIIDYWQSETVDKDLYLKNIRLSLNKSYKLVKATKMLHLKLKDYAYKQKANALNKE